MSDFYLNERMMQLSVEKAHRQAELRRLQKETGAGRTHWLARQRDWILGWLGSFLASSDERRRQSISPPPGAEVRANRGA